LRQLLCISLLLALLASAQELEESTCSSDDGAEKAGCLLQSRFGKDAPFAEISASAGLGFKQDKKISRQVALFEFESEKEGLQSKVEMVSAMLHETQARCKSYQAHHFYMRRSAKDLQKSFALLNLKLKNSILAKAKAKANATQIIWPKADSASLAQHKSQANQDPDEAEGAGEGEGEGDDFKTTEHDKIDTLISGFIDGQSDSEDAVHSKLLEARHQLNQLQDMLSELITEVNSTESALILYDKDLTEKLKMLAEVEKVKDEELKKCQLKKEEDTKMFLKLSAELMEMHQIASPSASMSLDKGQVHIGETVKHGDLNETTKRVQLSLVQHALRAVPTFHPKGNRNHNSVDVTQIPLLMKATHKAAAHLEHCHKKASLLQGEADEESVDESGKSKKGRKGKGKAKGKAKKSGLGWDEENEDENDENEEDENEDVEEKASMRRNMKEDMGKDDTYETSQGEASSDEKCKEEKEKLEDTYVKAYVELSRLKAEYEMLSKSPACFDAVNEEYNDKAPALQEEAERLSKLSKDAVEKLKELKPRLERAMKADKLLRKEVEDLTEEAAELPETLSDLGKVRDAIRALSLCPGLYRPEFKMPKWAGKWVHWPQDSEKQSDEEQDKAMGWACNEAFEGSRAAEHSEIEERTILDMPVQNTAEEPLMGICPGCAGDDDESFASKHARTCWKTEQPLNEQGVAKNCGKGKKVALCIVDEHNMRDIPGEGEREGAEEEEEDAEAEE